MLIPAAITEGAAIGKRIPQCGEPATHGAARSIITVWGVSITFSDT